MVSAKIAQEVLGSDKEGTAMQGFQTPYATKHAFNGWVDMFLNTPTGGLDDRYATLAADLQPYGVKLMAMYHTYSESRWPGRWWWRSRFWHRMEPAGAQTIRCQLHARSEIRQIQRR